MTDDEWLQDARDGKEHAAAFMVSRYGATAVGYCKSLGPDLSDVDHDFIAAIAVEKAVRKIDRYDPSRGPFEAWLRTFVRHAVQDWRRDRRATLALYENDAVRPLEPSSTSHNPLVEVLRDVLKTLSTADQVILHLRDFEGRTIQETAKALNITEAACRQRHHRARQRLKVRIQADNRAQTILTGEPA